MRVKRAGSRHNKTLESFDLDFNPNLNRAQLKELASCGFIEEKVAVLIAGPCGTGKSHLAQALGHCAVQKKVTMYCVIPRPSYWANCTPLAPPILMIDGSRTW